MYDMKLVKQVARKQKPMTRLLKAVMIILSILLILMGIALSRGFMFPGCLLLVLYFFYSTLSRKDYEYRLENDSFAIDVIYGKRYRKCVHVFDLEKLEVVAPHWHDAVAQYRRGGGVKLPKYDYTSYDDDIPYYTMIITRDDRKRKLLLDLDDEMLQMLKRKYPEKVFLS